MYSLRKLSEIERIGEIIRGNTFSKKEKLLISEKAEKISEIGCRSSNDGKYEPETILESIIRRWKEAKHIKKLNAARTRVENYGQTGNKKGNQIEANRRNFRNYDLSKIYRRIDNSNENQQKENQQKESQQKGSQQEKGDIER